MSKINPRFFEHVESNSYLPDWLQDSLSGLIEEAHRDAVVEFPKSIYARRAKEMSGVRFDAAEREEEQVVYSTAALQPKQETRPAYAPEEGQRTAVFEVKAKPCACGCGRLIPEKYAEKGWRYCWGHNPNTKKAKDKTPKVKATQINTLNLKGVVGYVTEEIKCFLAQSREAKEAIGNLEAELHKKQESLRSLRVQAKQKLDGLQLIAPDAIIDGQLILAVRQM